MNIEQQIKASVANGLSKPSIEALLGRSLTDDEIQIYRKYKAIYDLQERKRKNDKRHTPMSSQERHRKFNEKWASIDV